MTTRSLPACAISNAATQRIPLPQAATSPPSALRMRMNASAPPLIGGSITSNWSQPIPVRRSAMARASSSPMTGPP